MSQPRAFSWIEWPRLAALAMPETEEELHWLRQQGIQLLLSLTEDPPPRTWVNNAGLLLLHVPIVDLEAPSQDQLDQCISAVGRAMENNMGVAIHCGAGLGRTGTILAAFFVHRSMSAGQAIARVRSLRPGSVETPEQADAIAEFARRRKQVGSR
jgi:atypical dual specificity phosphatase